MPQLPAACPVRDWNQPPAAFRPQPLWVWNGSMTPERIRDSLRQFAARGIGGVFIHPRPGLVTEYLAAEWFELWKVALQTATELGLECHIYDENSYPSGFAGGHVMARNPGAAASMLLGTRLTHPFADAVRQLVGDCLGLVRWHPDAPAETLRRDQLAALPPDAQVFALELRCGALDAWQAGFTYVDICRPEVTDLFLELTHGAYFEHCGPAFGKALRYAFADEPEVAYGGHGFSLSPHLLAAFAAEHGYRLEEYLLDLCFPTAHTPERRHDYFKTLNRLFTENYARRCHDWCERHGIGFTGHFMEHQWPIPKGSPSSMAAQRWMHAPGIDLLGFQFTPQSLEANALYYLTVMEAVSVAAQVGRARVLCESCGGGGYDFGPAQMKPLEDFLLACGVNLINPHLSHQTLSGARKYDWPQTLSDHAPWWDGYGRQADHVGRVAYVLAQGQATANLLVLHPTQTGWLHYQPATFRHPAETRVDPLPGMQESYSQALVALHQAGLDYHLGDECILAEMGAATPSGLQVGRQCYQALLLPAEAETLEATTWQLLERFMQAGGQVHGIGPGPAREGGRPTSRAADWAARFPDQFRRHPTLAAALEALRPALRPQTLCRLESAKATVGSLMRREVRHADGSTSLFVCNPWQTPVEATLVVAGARRGDALWRLDTACGTEDCEALCDAEGRAGTALRLDPQGHALWWIGPAGAKAKPTAPRTPTVRKTPGLETVEARTPNILVLDYARYECPEAAPLTDNCVRLDQRHWVRQGLGRNPWHVSIQFRRTILERPLPAGAGFSVAYPFELESTGAPVGDLSVAIERPWLYAVSLNGQPLDQATATPWFDEEMRRLPLAAHLLRPGHNEIRLSAAGGHCLMEIMPIYLLGDFSLEARPAGFRMGPPQPLTLGDWTAQGRPFAPGAVRIRASLQLPQPVTRWRLEGEPWDGSLMEVRCAQGPLARWIPGEAMPWQSQTLSPGTLSLELTLHGHLKNLLGPHFSRGLPGLWSWREAPPQLPPGAAYHRQAFGLRALPEFIGA